MSDMTSAIGDILRVQRLLNGPSTRAVVLDGLSRATARIALPRPRPEVAVGLDEVLGARTSHYRFHSEPPAPRACRRYCGGHWGRSEWSGCLVVRSTGYAWLRPRAACRHRRYT